MSATGESTTSNVDPRVLRSRQAILAAAVDLLIDKGPSGVTVDAVVTASGVAKTTIYRHWDSRGELLFDVFRELCPEVIKPDPSLGFVDALREMMQVSSGQLSDERWRRAIPGLMMLKEHDDDFMKLHDELRESQTDVLDDVLRRGIREGLVRRSVTSDEAMPALFGPLFLTVLSGGDVNDEVIDNLIRRFLASEAYFMSAGSGGDILISRAPVSA